MDARVGDVTMDAVAHGSVEHEALHNSFSMLLTQRSPSSTETNLSTGEGVIVRDAVPHCQSDGAQQCICDDCTCTSCPTLFDWCVKDAIGLACNVIISLLFVYGYFVMAFVILIPRLSSLPNLIHFVLLHGLAFLSLSAYFRTVFADPGAVPLDDATAEKVASFRRGTVVYRCTACRSIKPSRARHCRVCQRCIRRMDHHCVFVNNCVGENNQKSFILFMCYTCATTLYTCIVVCARLINCVASNWTECPAWFPPVTLVLGLVLIIVTASFAIFTAIMTCIQLYCIHADITNIEFFRRRSMKHRRPDDTFLASLKRVFGGPVGINWLNPYAQPQPYMMEGDEHLTLDI